MEEEREWCAKIAEESELMNYGSDGHPIFLRIYKHRNAPEVAAAIRSATPVKARNRGGFK